MKDIDLTLDGEYGGSNGEVRRSRIANLNWLEFDMLKEFKYTEKSVMAFSVLSEMIIIPEFLRDDPDKDLLERYDMFTHNMSYEDYADPYASMYKGCDRCGVNIHDNYLLQSDTSRFLCTDCGNNFLPERDFDILNGENSFSL